MRLVPLLLVAAVAAQEEIEVVSDSEDPITNRILFVVDQSASMTLAGARRAMRAVVDIASQQTDDLEFGLIIFAADHVRWDPSVDVRQEGEPEGWVKAYPDTIDAAVEWVRQTALDKSSTRFLPPLRMAFQADREDQITVVLVTDGEWHDPENPPFMMACVRRLQDNRTENGFLPSRVAVWQYGTAVRGAWLSDLASYGGAPHVRATRRANVWHWGLGGH